MCTHGQNSLALPLPPVTRALRQSDRLLDELVAIDGFDQEAIDALSQYLLHQFDAMASREHKCRCPATGRLGEFDYIQTTGQRDIGDNQIPIR